MVDEKIISIAKSLPKEEADELLFIALSEGGKKYTYSIVKGPNEQIKSLYRKGLLNSGMNMNPMREWYGCTRLGRSVANYLYKERSPQQKKTKQQLEQDYEDEISNLSAYQKMSLIASTFGFRIWEVTKSESLHKDFKYLESSGLIKERSRSVYGVTQYGRKLGMYLIKKNHLDLKSDKDFDKVGQAMAAYVKYI